MIRPIGALALAMLVLAWCGVASAGPANLETAGSSSPCSDRFDPNESCSVPVPTLASGTYPGLVVSGYYDQDDVDWYRIALPRGMRLTATASFTEAVHKVEISMVDACGGNLLDDAIGANPAPQVLYDNV